MGTQVVKGLRGITLRGRGRQACFLWHTGRWGHLRAAYSYTKMGAVKTLQTLSALADRIRKSNGHKRHHGIPRLDTMTIFFTRRVVKSRHRFHMEAMGLLFMRVFTTSGPKAMTYPIQCYFCPCFE